MSERAYVQPKCLIGVLQYLNPNNEVLSADKILTLTSSSLQKLDPGENDRKVMLPEASQANGLSITIINSSIGVGKLIVRDYYDSRTIITIDPDTLAQCICVGEWGSYSSGSGGSFGGRYS